MAGLGDIRQRCAALALIGLIGGACSDEQVATSQEGQLPPEARQQPLEGLPRPPNVVLILIDTLRPDHLEPYGYDLGTSPFLARLAARSVVFERARSTSSWTAPSTASVFTGLYPNEHGVVAGFRAQSNAGEEADVESMQLIALPEGQTTLPGAFASAGYETLGLASNINIGSELGFDRDFRYFELLHRTSAEDLVEKAVAWRRGLEPGAAYFLYLHLNDVHKPYEGRVEFGYEAPEASDEVVDEVADHVAAYDSEIRYLDNALEQLFEQMGWNGPERASTLVMLISDHGEEFRDHGGWGHRFSLHAEVNDVLMMVTDPDAPDTSAGARVGANVSLIDVLPTLADAAGIRISGGRGRSLLPLVRAPSAPPSPDIAERVLFAQRVRGRSPKPLHERPALWAAVSGRWKLLFNDGDESVSLYDVEADPRELEDLAEAHPDVVQRLRAQLDDFRTGAVLRAGTEVEVQIDEELLKHLEELGYVGDE